MTAGSRGQHGETGAAFEDLLAEAGAQGAQQARGVSPADAEDDDRADQRGEGAEPEHLVAHQERAGRQDEDARQDRPELVGHPVVERQDLGPPLGRDDVVERAPGGIRQATLGDLLGEPDDRRGGDREASPARARTQRGRRAAAGERRRRPRTSRRPGSPARSRRRTRWPSPPPTGGRGTSPGPPRNGTSRRRRGGTGTSPRTSGSRAGRRRSPRVA